MFHLLKNEWKKISITVFTTIILLSLLACILSCTLYQTYILNYDLEAWEVGTRLIGFLFPLSVVIPICWNMYYEKKNNFLVYTMPRIGKRKYLTIKWIVSAFSAFFILFIPYFLSAVFALYVKAPIKSYNSTATIGVTPFNHVFFTVFTKTPLIYAFLLSIWKGFIGILVMSMGFVLSLYVKNIFIILTGPFIYVTLENFTLAVLQMPKFRLITAFEPSNLSVDSISAASYFVGPTFALGIILFMYVYFAKIKKISVFEV